MVDFLGAMASSTAAKMRGLEWPVAERVCAILMCVGVGGIGRGVRIVEECVSVVSVVWELEGRLLLALGGGDGRPTVECGFDKREIGVREGEKEITIVTQVE